MAGFESMTVKTGFWGKLPLLLLELYICTQKTHFFIHIFQNKQSKKNPNIVYIYIEMFLPNVSLKALMLVARMEWMHTLTSGLLT